MVSIQETYRHSYVTPALFLGAAYIAKKAPLAPYFQSATKSGMVVSAVLGSGASICVGRKFSHDKKYRVVSMLVGLALSSVLAPRVASALIEGGNLSLNASVRFACIQCALYGGVESFPIRGAPIPENPFCPTLNSEGVDARYQEIIPVIEAKRLHEMKGARQLAQALKELEGEEVFNLKNHELAKRVFQKVMDDRGLAVSYEDATDWNTESHGGELDLSIFQWSVTRGVQNDIPKASQDNRVHLFSVASQYNGAEAPDVFTPPVGEAMIKSQGDYTQGPLAQRSSPPVFELVSAFLTHLGFNMMEEVLPSAGKTYIGGSPIEHGYLRPNNGNLEQLQEEMERNYTKINIPCYESRPTDQGGAVYLMLGSAPAIGYSHGLNNDKTKALQYTAYKAVFIPLFKKAVKLLRDQPDKEVVLHMTGIGLGVFACDLETYSAAFKEVALQFQSGLSEEEKRRIHVQFESYQGNDRIKGVASRLGLGEAKPRVE